MSASKAGTMDISKAPEALVQEARKYKSAEEFDDAVNYSSNAVSSEKYNL